MTRTEPAQQAARILDVLGAAGQGQSTITFLLGTPFRTLQRWRDGDCEPEAVHAARLAMIDAALKKHGARDVLAKLHDAKGDQEKILRALVHLTDP